MDKKKVLTRRHALPIFVLLNKGETHMATKQAKTQMTVAEIRAQVERGKALAAARFERELGVPMTRENVARVVRRGAELAMKGRRSISKSDL